jgi:hypothetical protein
MPTPKHRASLALTLRAPRRKSRDTRAEPLTLPPVQSWGQFLHALPHPLHGAHARPALEEVDLPAFLLPDPTAHPLVQVAAEKVEALVASREVHLPRLLRVQLQTETRHHVLHASLGLLDIPSRPAHHDEIVRVANQHAKMRAPLLPHGVERGQVDIRQER